MGTLILLRHGESAWNARQLFTGWTDVGLTSHGEQQAERCGELLREAGLVPDAVHSSVLTRAVRTADLVAGSAGAHGARVTAHWRLNERHYGALQGREKGDVLEEFGEERFRLWRRSYDAAPPPVAEGAPGDVSDDPRYADVPRSLLPRTESLGDVTARLLPYWHQVVVPDLRAGRTTLLVAHSNSLRALVAHLDRMGREEVPGLNIPTAMPLWYDLGEDLKPRVRGGRYLEPAAAATAAAEVAAEGFRSSRATR
ncbi:2,3-bisphosphoglycerate-dependent phosphoglycerate mutase [Streptomyces sp. MI02-2A]|uniref:2,3-bisphosphoglycerate-dependent phosphoglycerate mutase n=1 Tax=unclassified Streptomyces TaxID=2593676 RepID=UPI0007412D07|nr:MULTISPECIES: 2,3-bisphosphoglycerate-dependent phosphoglycerate mutase [unclassified Streptomyces]KUJ34958.1 phosphoglycerate mutase [Streptomyces sp. NRRL F-5122]MDX3263833.1 2,3-bisphosphoglycerate-dependent phosphoglycerate mutase [Streptomyces sp. MI02-2A]REE57878.1 2,3-bisphosphoglycerate-dependent phosphoglycerate mutase [Streptomyces sp. 3212.3]